MHFTHVCEENVGEFLHLFWSLGRKPNGSSPPTIDENYPDLSALENLLKDAR